MGKAEDEGSDMLENKGAALLIKAFPAQLVAHEILAKCQEMRRRMGLNLSPLATAPVLSVLTREACFCRLFL